MTLSSFFSELRRRNVLRAAAFYAAAGWLLVQIATQVFPFFDIPNWAVRLIVIAVAVGFPFALAFAWFYELTPEGLKRESDIERTDSITHATSKRLDRWIIAALSLAVVVLLANIFVPRKDASTLTEKSIAVLPFANEGGKADDQYFSDGLSEDLIVALGQFPDLKVISRGSAFRFRGEHSDIKAIGETLGVAHLLEGSVSQENGMLRIRAELVKVSDGSILWSGRYDRPSANLFSLQDDITEAVAAALKTRLLTGAESSAAAQRDRPPSGDLDAYDAYLQGNFHLARHGIADLRKAVAFYQQAIRLDPHYARALAKLSLSWGALGNRAGGRDAADFYAKARAAAQQALALDAQLADAHYALGSLMMTADWNFPGAQAQFLLAGAQTSDVAAAHNGLASVLACLGQLDAAVEMQRKAIALDPLQAAYQLDLAIYLIPLGRYGEAQAAARQVLALQAAKPAVHTLLAIIAIKQGDAATALREAGQEPDPAWKAYALALAQYAAGDTAAAAAALKAMIADHAEDSPFQIATVYASRGEADHAFEWLDRALAVHDSGVNELLFSPFLLTLKDDPRFAVFCRKVGLPVPGAAPATTTASTSP